MVPPCPDLTRRTCKHLQHIMHIVIVRHHHMRSGSASFASTIPFHIFSLILTALSRLAFNFLFSVSNSANLSLLESTVPLVVAATVFTLGRKASNLLDPLWPRTRVHSCTSLATLPALIRSRALISIIGHPSFLPPVVPTRSGGRKSVEICVIGD